MATQTLKYKLAAALFLGCFLSVTILTYLMIVQTQKDTYFSIEKDNWFFVVDLVGLSVLADNPEQARELAKSGLQATAFLADSIGPNTDDYQSRAAESFLRNLAQERKKIGLGRYSNAPTSDVSVRIERLLSRFDTVNKDES